MPPEAVDETVGGDGEHVVPRAGGGPHLVVVEQVGVDEHGERRGVAERRDTADREPGHAAHGVGVDPGAAQPAGGRRQLGLVELVAPADVGEHHLAVDGEDQALHDLADIDADRRRRVGCGLRAVREVERADLDPTLAAGRDDPLDVGMSHSLDDLSRCERASASE